MGLCFRILTPDLASSSDIANSAGCSSCAPDAGRYLYRPRGQPLHPITASLPLISAVTATPAMPRRTPAKTISATLKRCLACSTSRRSCILGNSLGGVNAYQFAARHPERVKALIIEDIGAVVTDDISFVLSLAGFLRYTGRTRREDRCPPCSLLKRLVPPFRRRMASGVRSARYGAFAAEPGRRPLG